MKTHARRANQTESARHAGLVFTTPPFTPQLVEVINRARIAARARKDQFVRMGDVQLALNVCGSFAANEDRLPGSYPAC